MRSIGSFLIPNTGAQEDAKDEEFRIFRKQTGVRIASADKADEGKMWLP